MGGFSKGSKIMRCDHPPEIMVPPPMACPCCGQQERTSGCVRGFPCACKWDYCYVCHKCVTHCTCEGGPERDRKRAERKWLLKELAEARTPEEANQIIHLIQELETPLVEIDWKDRYKP